MVVTALHLLYAVGIIYNCLLNIILMLVNFGPENWSRLLHVHIDTAANMMSTQVQNSNKKETIISTNCNNNIDDLTEPP